MNRRERDKRDWIGFGLWFGFRLWGSIGSRYLLSFTINFSFHGFSDICVEFVSVIAWLLSCPYLHLKIYLTPLYTFPKWGIRLQLSLLVLDKRKRKHKHTTKVWFMAATNGSIFASSTKPIQTTPSIFCSKASPSSNTLGGFSWSLVMHLIFIGFPLFACNYFMGTCQKLVICDLLEILEPNPLLKLCTTFDC